MSLHTLKGWLKTPSVGSIGREGRGARTGRTFPKGMLDGLNILASNRQHSSEAKPCFGETRHRVTGLDRAPIVPFNRACSVRPMTLKTLLVAASLAAAAVTGPAFAAGEVGALNNTVVGKFKPTELALMNSSVKAALAAEKDGETLDWKSDERNASGTVTPLDRHEYQTLSCRRVRIVNNLGRRTQQGVYRFCEKPVGSWKLVGPA